MDFNDLWFNHALLMAKKSKDPRTQVGAVIVNQESRQLISAGYNGPPRGWTDSQVLRLNKEEKALVCEHAERNAIYNAARLGMATNKCHMYVTLSPCNDCARGMIQAGIKTVWVPFQFYTGWPVILGNLVETKIVNSVKWEFSSIKIDGKNTKLEKT